MKQIQFFVLAAAIFVISSCGMPPQKDEEAIPEKKFTSKKAICIANNVDIQKYPARRNDQLGFLNLNDTVTIIDDTLTKNNQKYYKINLTKEKAGWIDADFFIIDASEMAVVKNKTPLYHSAGLISPNGQKLRTLDMVAILSKQNPVWKVMEIKERKTGWIDKKNLTTDKIELEIASKIAMARSPGNTKDLNIVFRDIIKNPDYASSGFIDAIRNYISDVKIYRIIYVDTIEKLLAAISSNTRIFLDAEEFSLDKTRNITVENPRIDTKNGVSINNVHNLIFDCLDKKPARLISTDTFSYILEFTASRNIVFRNVVVGHSPETDECRSGVLHFVNCQNVFLHNTELFGSGTTGINANDVDSLVLSRSVIQRCSKNAILLNNCRNIYSLNSKIIENTGDSLIVIHNSRNIVFDKSELTGNKSAADSNSKLFSVEGVFNIRLINSQISQNDYDTFKTESGNIHLSGNVITDNSFELSASDTIINPVYEIDPFSD